MNLFVRNTFSRFPAMMMLIGGQEGSLSYGNCDNPPKVCSLDLADLNKIEKSKLVRQKL